VCVCAVLSNRFARCLNYNKRRECIIIVVISKTRLIKQTELGKTPWARDDV